MRAISLVNKLEFQFMGNVARNALTLGDLDNDGCNELVIGNNTGEVAVFKGKEKMQTMSDLGFVSCVAVGDVLNKKRNSLVIVAAHGWCYIYDCSPGEKDDDLKSESDEKQPEEQAPPGEGKPEDGPLKCIHTQRIPANAKNIVIGDLDGDGQNEMILGLTDRVVRSYRWLDEPSKAETAKDAPPFLGRFVALNKWECANQIGSITLHHSSNGKPALLIAQPGGTFMRVRCQTDDALGQTNDSGASGESSSTTTESMPGSAVDYQFLGISRMRNQNISTEILGDFKSGAVDPSIDVSRRSSGGSDEAKLSCAKKCPYALATLDGTIMLVQDEVILWAIAVDHQVFALTKLDVTGNGRDDIVVCSWDGETYILDQDKNSVRFHLDEAVQAFESGHYSLPPSESPVTCLVYVTFKNTVIVHYDIPLRELVCTKFEPDTAALAKLYVRSGLDEEEAVETVNKMDKKTKSKLVQLLLYNC